MKRVGMGAALAGLLVPLVAGCGSGNSPPFSIACTNQHLGSGMIRTVVTVTNSSSTPGKATVYGPVFSEVQHFYPPSLAPGLVTVKGKNGSASYTGFVVSQVRADGSARLIFRFSAPPHAEAIAVTDSRVIDAGDSDPLASADCKIG